MTTAHSKIEVPALFAGAPPCPASATWVRSTRFAEDPDEDARTAYIAEHRAAFDSFRRAVQS